MGEIDIEELDFAQASEEDRRGLYEVVAAWTVEGSPGKEPPPYEACIAMWEHRDDVGFEPPHFVVARAGGKIVGYGQVQISEAEANAHLANVNVVVLPQHRRRGIGTALLRAVPSLSSGRTVIESWNVFKGSPAEQFAAARGFRVVASMIRQRLVLTELPEVGEVPAGYELVTWNGVPPEEFIEVYVEGLNAITEARYGDTTLDLAHNTVESVRGEDCQVVLLLHGGEAAGVTVVERNSTVPAVAEQLHTVVLPAHRGKGLGRLIKARMLHDLTGIETIYTRTSSENEHMRRVNHSLGYTDVYTYLAVQKKIADPQP